MNFIKEVAHFVHLNPTNGEFGIEVEAEFKRGASEEAFHGTKAFRAEGDGSLKKNGLEFVSKGAFSFKDSVENLKTLFKIQDFGDNYYPSGRTSTHIHCNMQHKTPEEILKILLLAYLLEPVVTRFGGLQREGNLFCLRLCDAEDGLRPVQNFIDKRYNDIQNQADNHKYAGINIAPLLRFGTIEFRCFEGTNRASRVVDWLKVCRCIIKEAERFDTLDEVWRKWTNDRRRLLTDVFRTEPELLEKIMVSCGYDLEGLLDMNHSLVYSIILWDRNKDLRKAKAKPANYAFPRNEQELDVEEEF